MSWRARYSRIARSASSECRRCGPDCQRRASWLRSPPSPRTLTAKPSRTLGLRVGGAAGPRPPLGVVGRLDRLDLLLGDRIGRAVDRLVDLRLLGRETRLAVLGGVAQLGLGLLLTFGLASA